MPNGPSEEVVQETVVHGRPSHTWRTVLLSIVVVGSVACTWALSTQFSKTALVIDPAHFYAPYTMMWFNTCFMILCYPVFLAYEAASRRNLRKSHLDASSIFGDRGLHPISLITTVLPFLLFWIGANYSYSASLLYISASVATSISSCNAAMVYLLAVLILHDKFVPMKVLSVVLAVAGVVVMSLSGEMRAQWQGVVLSVTSAASAAFYKVLFKRYLGHANLGQVSLFMTCLGFLNLSCNWVPALTLVLTHVEHVEIAYVPWAPLLGASLLSLLFNFLINFGIALLHPLVVSVGMLMGIPLNTVIDVIFRHVDPTANFIGGTALIMSSFILIVFPYEILFRRKPSKSVETSANTQEVSGLPDHLQNVFEDGRPVPSPTARYGATELEQRNVPVE
nr:Protein of unknown function DUF6 domain containing protein [Haemonchus contortus]